MTLPILLIFYVSKWKNNKKHWKTGIWRHCDVIIGRGKSKLAVGLLCTEMIIVCKFHDPSIICSRDTEGGPRGPPPRPQQQIDQKSPVWIGLTWEQQYAQNTVEALHNGREQVLWARQIVGSGSLDPTWEWTSIDYTKVTQTLFTLTTCWSNMICKHSSKMA